MWRGGGGHECHVIQETGHRKQDTGSRKDNLCGTLAIEGFREACQMLSLLKFNNIVLPTWLLSPMI